jgi:hypothetical protein
MNERDARLAELERTVDTCPDLGQVMNAFFDVIQADPGLTFDARPFDSADLTTILRKAARHALQADGRRRRGPILASWLRVAERGFVHGQVVACGYIGAAFFFERRGLGMVALVTGESSMLYTRLRVLGRPKADPVRN